MSTEEYKELDTEIAAENRHKESKAASTAKLDEHKQ